MEFVNGKTDGGKYQDSQNYRQSSDRDVQSGISKEDEINADDAHAERDDESFQA